MAYRGNLKKRMKQANKVAARAAVILGEVEVARGMAKLRDLDTGAEQDVPLDGLVSVCRGGGDGR